MTLFEEIHGKFVGIADYLAVGSLLAEESCHIREDIECALRLLVKTEARNLLNKVEDEIATALESLTHHLDTLLRTSVGCFCGLLCNA